MDPNTARSAQTALKKGNNTMLYAGIAGAALVGYYFYKKRQGDVQNIGDAVSVLSPLACSLPSAQQVRMTRGSLIVEFLTG